MSNGASGASAVVFDFGGVMTTCATPVRVKEIADEAGLPWQAVLDGFARHRRAYDIGDITVSEFYARTWRDAGVEVDPATEAKIEEADSTSFLHPNMRTLDWMRSLKGRGFRLGILTNMPRELAPLFREHFADFIATADALVVSSEVHLVKPMPEIYALVERRLGVPPAEIAFVDDSPVNCGGAAACGWRPVLFKDNAQAESDLEGLLAKIARPAT